MSRRCYRRVLVIGITFLGLLLLVSFFRASTAGFTRLDITEEGTGRLICSTFMCDGEEAVLSWRNSLFDLNVIEVFNSRRGLLVLDTVTFADPRGLPPAAVPPADVDDLYHTGGPFTARGIGRSFKHVIYRVSEIGNPTIKLRNHIIDFKAEVGFGGGVVLSATPASWLEYLGG